MELPPTENKEVINNTKQYYADVIKNHGGNPQDLKLWVIGRQTYFLYISLSYDLSIESTDGCGRHNEVQDKLKYWQDRLAQVKYEFNESKSKNPISYISKTAVYKILDSVPVTEICDGCHGQGRVACTSCNGTGSKPCSMCYGSCKTSCTSCHGRGVSYDNQTSYDSQGNSVTTQVHNTCSICYGNGEINCTFCNGFGTERCHACSSGKVSCHGCAGNGHVTKTYSIQSVAKPTYQVFSGDAHDLKIAEISKYFSQSNTKDFLSHIPVYHIENGSFLETQENGNQIFYYQGSVSVADIKIQYVDHSFEVVSVNDIPDIGMYPLAEHVLKIVNDDIQKFSDNIKSKSIVSGN
ncbi:hypothetical protein Acife_1985 [Acidithiobacillus ferrivorans SS3]|uniref:CR-type domain-containing protein n=1 Tax=Acidithiobacillus ferrivorans SS3 TaxID=743299 RepID=G0JM55_9PROT|nr:hypothetical protein [Acidithiobacillus ferrivorans]AEM48105.1 hypothetical protein Acife_1985 [Acidithiobacillus ferrivorans SS3]